MAEADVSALDAAIADMIERVAAGREGDPGRDELLGDLGNALGALFDRTGRRGYLDAALAWYAAAWDEAAADSPLRARHAGNRGAALLSRYRHFHEAGDLDNAVRWAGTAVGLTDTQDPALPGRLHNLGNALERRFEFRGDRADLDEAVRIREAALAALPGGAPLTATLRTGAGNTARTRYEHTGERADLDAAVAHHRAALGAAAPGRPMHTIALSNLGVCLLDRGDIDEAVSCDEAAAEATSPADPMYGVRLSNLGLALRRRYERDGGLHDLDRSVTLHQRAVAELSAGYAHYADTLGNLGAVHHMRHRHLGSDEDLDLAAEYLRRAATADSLSDTDRARWLGSLGSVLLSRFRRHERMSDLDESISTLTRAVRLTPERHADRAQRLHNLASSQYTRFLRTGDPGQLDEAIESHTAAVLAAPDGTGMAALARGGLAGALESRYVINRSATDLAKAIEHSRAAVDGAGARAPDGPTWQANLGGALARRFLLTRDRGDIDEAVERLRDAVGATPDGHRDLPLRLTTLTEALLARFETAHALPDIDEAVAVAERAVGAARDGSVAHASALNDLGALLLARAEAGGDGTDLNRSIATQERALREYPSDHPDRLAVLRALGLALRNRAERDGALAARVDADRAVTLLTEATALVAERPGRESAITWFELARAYRARALTATDAQARDADLARSREAGLRAARDGRWDVLIQSGTADGLAAVRYAAYQVRAVTAWCLLDGATGDALSALELGRGLVVHAATVTGTVAQRLRAAGRVELAGEWDAERARSPRRPRREAALTRAVEDLVPSRLRYQVVAALAGAGAEPADDLLAPVPLSAIRTALAGAGVDAMVHLVPGDTGRDGFAIITTGRDEPRQLTLPQFRAVPGGPLAVCVEAFNRFLLANAEQPRDDPAVREQREAARAAWVDALAALCDWSWQAVMAPLLAELPGPLPRIVLVPIRHAGLVPWHAARTADPARPAGYRYAVEDAVISYAASARLFADTAGREPAAPDGRALIVGNPTRDLPAAQLEAQRISAYYSDGVRLGSAGLAGVAPATPDAVLAALPGAESAGLPVVHLACHGTMRPDPADSYLRLAGRQRLTVERLLAHSRDRHAGAPGPLVVLSACESSLTTDDFDEALTLATTFLVAGASAAVGSLWSVDDRRTAELMTEFHRRLTAERLTPADALRAAQLWMIGAIPGASAAAPSFADPFCWAAFTHQGA